MRLSRPQTLCQLMLRNPFAGFGPRGRLAVSFFQFAFAFGVSSFSSLASRANSTHQGMCAFCVILGDTIPRVLVALVRDDPGAFISFLISRSFVITFLTLGVSYPLSLYRDIEKLSKASALALVRRVLRETTRARSELIIALVHSMVVIVISVGVRGPGVEEDLKGDPAERWSFVRSGVFEAIGVISFAFVVGQCSCIAIFYLADVSSMGHSVTTTHVSSSDPPLLPLAPPRTPQPNLNLSASQF